MKLEHWLFLAVAVAVLYGIYALLKNIRDKADAAKKAIAEGAEDFSNVILPGPQDPWRDANPTGAAVSDFLDAISEWWGYLGTAPVRARGEAGAK